MTSQPDVPKSIETRFCQECGDTTAEDERWENCRWCGAEPVPVRYVLAEVTEEIVERARRAYVAECSSERATSDSLGDCLRAALAAAFSTTRAEGDQWHCEHRGIAQVVEQRNAGPYCAECGAIIERARSRKDAP